MKGGGISCRTNATRHAQLETKGRTVSVNVGLLDLLGISDRNGVNLSRKCVPVRQDLQYSIIIEQYSTSCPRGIQYPLFSYNFHYTIVGKIL